MKLFSTFNLDIPKKLTTSSVELIKKTIPLETFISNDNKFLFHTYLCVVEDEFIPNLNSEHNGYAWTSFNNWPKPDLLIISAHKQLRVALKTFNAFSWNPYLAKCPVFLIGAGRHKEILAAHAKVDHLRKIILTPFETDLFVRVINELIRRAKRS